MRQVTTEIVIEQAAEKIWNILINFENYADWNPVIRSIEAEEKPGTKVKISQVLGGKVINATAVIKKITYPEFCWTATLLSKRIIRAEHYFKIEKISETRCRFVHGEKFYGFLGPLILKKFSTLKEDFNRMNQALAVACESDS